MTSNFWRCLETLFGIEIKQKRFYTFMASTTLPWQRLWQTVWSLIPSPETDGRLLVALDDFINPKVGRHIFGCETLFDHAAKANQSRYPWAQNIVSVGLLKRIKGSWACLFLDYRFYLPKKTIQAQRETATLRGKVVPFQTKLEQASQMLIGIANYFSSLPVIAVTDSWFANKSLWKPVRQALGDRFHLLSRLRSNNALYDCPDDNKPGQRGRRRKYDQRLGSVTELAKRVQQKAKHYSVHLYGHRRDVCAYEQIVMLKTLRCPVRVVWVFRKTRWVALFTTELDLSVTQLIEYYGARWKIELDFRNIKTTLGMDILSCRTPEMVQKEIWVYLLAYNLIRHVMLQSALLVDILPRQISFKHSLRIWVLWSQQSQESDSERWQYVLILIAQNKLGNRPGRVEPRAVKRRPKPFPLLTQTRYVARQEIRENGHPKKLK